MLIVEIVLAAVIVFGVAAVAMGYGGSITQFKPDWPGHRLPEGRTLRAEDVAAARFSLAFRGYRMHEVDEALDRLALEIAERDARIEQLTGHPYEAPVHEGEGYPTPSEQLDANLPTDGEPPTTEPPTAEPPTAELPTAQPPAAEPPAAEPPAAELPPVTYGEPSYDGLPYQPPAAHTPSENPYANPYANPEGR